MKIRVLILLSSIFFLISCAQIVPLSGGDKDVEPPKEVESTPKNGSLNFTENQITIEFDEFIQLQNLQSQLIISPLMEEKPEVVVKGKKLVIKLQDTLQQSTTYSFNFGEAIVDITENNPIPNYKYVFSTGNYLDSLSYSGTVVNAFDLTPKEKTFVLLYNQFEDSIPYKELPRYVAITDKEGKFSISNIANGTYKVFAINDINSNYLFDLPNEEVAFLDEPIVLNENKSGDLLYSFEESFFQQYIVSKNNTAYGRLDLVLNIPNDSYGFGADTSVLRNFNYENNAKGDSITLWFKNPLQADSSIIEIYELVPVKGEIGQAVHYFDTLTISIDKKLVLDSSLKLNTNASKNFDLGKQLRIVTERPIAKTDYSKIILLEDSNEVKIGIEKLKGTNVVHRKFDLDYVFKENTNYQLVILPEAFEDIYGQKNDTLISDFKTKSKSDYGTIDLSISPNFNEYYIVQLYKNEKIVKEFNHKQGETEIKLDFLNPGNYSLKLIIDNNNDRKWTTGLYIDKRQPEKVIYYEKPIVLKANWDNEINWIIKE